MDEDASMMKWVLKKKTKKKKHVIIGLSQTILLSVLVCLNFLSLSFLQILYSFHHVDLNQSFTAVMSDPQGVCGSMLLKMSMRLSSPHR